LYDIHQVNVCGLYDDGGEEGLHDNDEEDLHDNGEKDLHDNGEKDFYVFPFL
jgi:hypothetical protein